MTVDNPLEALSWDEVRTRTSEKWRAHPSDVLPLWVAEMDVAPAEPVVRAVTDAMRRGDTGYAVVDDYVAALDGFARRRWGWDGVTPRRSAIVPDVMLGIVEVLKVLTDPGDPVIVNSPVYPPFFAFVEHSGRPIVEAPLGGDGRLDLDGLERAFRSVTADHRRTAFLLCNPQNPTGTVHTRDELAAVAALATRYGVRIVVDEIHAALVLPGATFTPFLTVPGAESAFVLHSASKAWNLAGLKAALAIAGPDAVDDLARIPEEVSHGPSHVGVIAHAAALRDGDDWLDALLRGLHTNRTLLRDLVADRLPGVRLQWPEATYLGWLDFGAVPGMPAEQPGSEREDMQSAAGPAGYFLEHARVALTSGAPFGTGGGGHARINYATSAATLAEAIERMAAALPR